MTSLFISYSRKDIEIARKLSESFKGQRLDFWIDWEGIAPTVDWWKEIEKGIEEASIFLFLISPDSAKSKVCRQEIQHAVKNGKRLIPVVVRDIKAEESPDELSHLNWIFLRETDHFEDAFTKLINAIETDFEWAQTHKQIQVKALEWERNNRESSFLLRGKELQNAEVELSSNSSKEPYPTNLQREYVLKSRQATDRQRKITTGISIAGIISLAMLAIFGFVQAGLATASKNEAQAASTLAVANAATAEANAQIAIARQFAAQATSLQQSNLQLSMLLGIEAFKTENTAESLSVLLSNTEKHSQLIGFLGNESDLNDGAKIAISPDGKIVATGGINHSIVLWNIEDRQPIGSPLTGHKNIITNLAFNQDGTILASAGQDGLVIFWDTATHKKIGVFPMTGIIDSIAFSPNGKILAVSGNSGNIVLWNMETHNPNASLIEANNGNFGTKLAFNPDGNLLAYTSCDFNDQYECLGKIVIWDMLQNTKLTEFPVNQSRLSNLTFSPNGKFLASNSDDRILLWDTSLNSFTQQILPNSIGDYVLTFSPDSKILAASEGTSIVFWDLETRQKGIQSFLGHSSEATSAAFTPNGKLLISQGCNINAGYSFELCDKGEVLIWQFELKTSLGKKLLENGSYWGDISFSPDGNILATGDTNGNVLFWDASTYTPITPPLKAYTSPRDNLNVLFSPDGKTIATQDEQGIIILWDAITHKRISQPLQSEAGYETNMAFSPNGSFLVSGSLHSIMLWDINTGKSIGSPIMEDNNSSTLSFAFSPDGKILAYSTCIPYTTYDINTTGICSFQQIFLLDVPSLKYIETLDNKQTGVIHTLAFSPDGKILAAGTGGNGVEYASDSNITFWDLSTYQPIGEPLNSLPFNTIFSLAFSPNGKTLVSASEFEGIRLWDVETQESIGLLSFAFGNAQDIVYSSNGKFIASTNSGSVTLWGVDPQSWINNTCEQTGRNFTLKEWRHYFPGKDYQKTCLQWTKDISYYNFKAQEIIANNPEDIQTSFEKLKTEMQEDKAPEWWFSQLLAQTIPSKAKNEYYRLQNIETTISILNQGEKLGLELRNIASLEDITFLQDLCWQGNKNGHAQKVLEYCNIAVVRATAEDPALVWNYRDSRGVARALTGDYSGAIQDFQYFIDNSTEQENLVISQRKYIIEELKKGNNPFTAEFLNLLAPPSTPRG